MMVDPTRRARSAIYALIAWLVCDFVFSTSRLATIAALAPNQVGFSVEPTTADSIAQPVAIVQLLSTVVAITLVARWIMRVNANAQTVSDSMTISPGWNVGYFFVPIVNLWKPFEGIRQSWQASVAPHHPASVAVPIVMRWWWGLWLATNILGNISFRLGLRGGADGLIASSWIDLVTFLIDVPLVWFLVQVIQQLTAIQRDSKDIGEIFS
jgi:Domain of unknown function (DUF4328)